MTPSWRAWAPWTPHLQPVIVALVAAVLTPLWVAWLADRSTLPDIATDGPRAAELATRLDPNGADAAALSAVPGLGPGRARAIVEYREAAHASHPDRPAFTSARDLLPIHGIGVTTLENLEPYLAFPPTAAPTGTKVSDRPRRD